MLAEFLEHRVGLECTEHVLQFLLISGLFVQLGGPAVECFSRVFQVEGLLALSRSQCLAHELVPQEVF
jgi:hypothetical protein